MTARGAAARNKGNRSERDVVNFLKAHGFPTKTSRDAERGAGRQSRHGDLVIEDAPDVVVDVKDRQRLHIPQWIDQLVEEAESFGTHKMVLIVKRPLTADPGRWLAVWACGPIPRFRTVIAMDKPTVEAIHGWLDIEPPTSRVAWVYADRWWSVSTLAALTEYVLPAWTEEQ